METVTAPISDSNFDGYRSVITLAGDSLVSATTLTDLNSEGIDEGVALGNRPLREELSNMELCTSEGEIIRNLAR